MRFLRLIIKPLAALFILALIIVAGGLAYYQPPLADAPGIGTRMLRYLSGAPVETAKYSAYPELRMKDFPRAREEVFNAAVSAAQAMEWEIVSVDAEAFHLEALASYPIPEIKGRIRVEIRETDEGLSALYVRSDTVGPWPDFGANTRRVVDYYDKIELFL
ncbi:DUF1499 domain-containing protein [Ectothiorhodospiraceae bacterium WFHF3C12]|nr:DUF1499 domain-containing protein [Ectothiorhodospiraceae bacterium WFHF3C12]